MKSIISKKKKKKNSDCHTDSFENYRVKKEIKTFLNRLENKKRGKYSRCRSQSVKQINRHYINIE